MTEFYSIPKLKRRRRLLRRQPIPSEILMWSVLRGRKFMGVKFRRQYSIGKYIVDFYCPALRLVIEIDGISHELPGRFEYDRARQYQLEQSDISVVRFDSRDVMDNLDGVLFQLGQTLKHLQQQPGLYSARRSYSHGKS